MRVVLVNLAHAARLATPEAITEIFVELGARECRRNGETLSAGA